MLKNTPEEEVMTYLKAIYYSLSNGRERNLSQES